MLIRIQFSLYSLLLVTAVIAFTAAAFVWEPSLCTLLVRSALTISVATLTVTASIYTQGMRKAFWIGAAVPAVAAAWMGVMGGFQLVAIYHGLGVGHAAAAQIADIANALRFSVFLWCYAPINGIACGVICRLFASVRGRTE